MKVHFPNVYITLHFCIYLYYILYRYILKYIALSLTFLCYHHIGMNNLYVIIELRMNTETNLH